MAFTVYGDIWKEVRLSVPGADPFLVKKWVADAYRQLSDYRGWQWLVFQDQIVWRAPETLDVTVTQGSVQVTSAALFTTAMAGRQFRVGTGPIYTVQTFVDPSTIELDLAYEGSLTGAQEATIFDAFATMPVRFGRFIVILDHVRQCFVPWWMSQDELALLDPARSSVNSGPQTLVSARPSTYPPTLGQMQYEFWPRVTAAGTYSYYAVSRPEIPADTDRLPGVLGHRGDVLETGALAAAAKWPGTATYRNPYFNIALATKLDQEFKALCLQLDLRDDDQAQQSIQTIPWHRWSRYGWAYDTHLLQMTDATLADYWGGGGYWGNSYWP